MDVIWFLLVGCGITRDGLVLLGERYGNLLVLNCEPSYIMLCGFGSCS